MDTDVDVATLATLDTLATGDHKTLVTSVITTVEHESSVASVCVCMCVCMRGKGAKRGYSGFCGQRYHYHHRPGFVDSVITIATRVPYG